VACTRNPDADDLYRSIACLHVLAPRHRRSAADEISNHVAIVPMGEHEQFLNGTLRVAAEQL
jgi:hypothetical protein